MDEVENLGVLQELAAPETENHIEQESPQVQKEDPQERNWREMRKKQADLERRLEERERKLEEKDALLNQFLVKQMQPQQQQEIDELESTPNEEWANAGVIKKSLKKTHQQIREEAAQVAREEVQKAIQQEYQNKFKERLKASYSDFDEVVNDETVNLLQTEEPELAASLSQLKDPYLMGLSAYKYIKALGIKDKVPGARRAKEVEKRLEKNASTVPSPQAYDKRPMAQAFKQFESEDERKKLYQEMYGYASQAGFGF